MTSNYAAWEIQEKDFPLKSDMAAKVRFLLGYGILAPSTHNTQPWKFSIKENTLIITADPLLNLPYGDPTGRNLHISLGCCVENLQVAAGHFGVALQVVRVQAGVIELSFETKRGADTENLFGMLTQRFSNKLVYDDSELKAEDRHALERTHGLAAGLTLIEDRTVIERIANLQQKAATATGSRGFAKELAKWLRPNQTLAGDGMPGFVVGLKDAQAKVLRVLIRNFPPIIKLLAKKDRAAILLSSAGGVITSLADTPEAWFNTGRLYERVALRAAAQGMAMAPMAAMIEDVSARTDLIELVGISGKVQIFFRLGYNKDKHYHTPRRSVEKALEA